MEFKIRVNFRLGVKKRDKVRILNYVRGLEHKMNKYWMGFARFKLTEGDDEER